MPPKTDVSPASVARPLATPTGRGQTRAPAQFDGPKPRPIGLVLGWPAQRWALAWLVAVVCTAITLLRQQPAGEELNVEPAVPAAQVLRFAAPEVGSPPRAIPACSALFLRNILCQ